MSDPFDLQRFVDAQAGVIDQVRQELASGRKRTHWMWFVFPQLAGLGSSAMARRYAVSSLEEAQAYLAHGVLGPRLVECTGLIPPSASIAAVFGSPDDLKFHSCMTLFARAGEGVFRAALARHFGGREDMGTATLLFPSPSPAGGRGPG